MKNKQTPITLAFLLGSFLLSACSNTYDKSQLEAITLVTSDTQQTTTDKNLIPFESPETHLFGYKTKTGKVKIPPLFVRAHDFNNFGIANVKLGPRNEDWAKINKSGEILVKSYFFNNGPDYYAKGLSRFVENNKIGFIDFTAKKVIPAQFDWASPFHYNAPISLVCNGCKLIPSPSRKYKQLKGGKWGVIDMAGRIIIPLQYDNFKSKEKDTLTLVKNNELHKIYSTKQGKIVVIK